MYLYTATIITLTKLSSASLTIKQVIDTWDAGLVSSLSNHGCHCSRIFGVSESLLQSAPLSIIDSHCYNYQVARRCLQFSTVCEYEEFDYDLSSGSIQNNACAEKLRELDLYFQSLITSENIQPVTGTCIEGAAAAVDRSEQSCCLSDSYESEFYFHAEQSCVDGSVTSTPAPVTPTDVANVSNQLENQPLTYNTTNTWSGPTVSNLNNLNGQFGSSGQTSSRRRRKRHDHPLPDSYDSRSDSECGELISVVKNQEDCSSDYAFVSAETISHSLCKATNGDSQTQLAPMDLMNCYVPALKDAGNACAGGNTFLGLDHFKNDGFVTGGADGCFPYQLTASNYLNPLCPTNCPNSAYSSAFSSDKRRATEMEKVQLSNEEDIKHHIILHGAVSTSFVVFKDFYAYKDGVYTQSSNVRVGRHAVNVVGWGSENNIDYWLCKNTWGSGHGEGGFFKIRRGTNECDIEKEMVGLAWHCPGGSIPMVDGSCEVVDRSECVATLVRQALPGAFHPASDSLAGSDVYGVPGEGVFSIKFDETNFDTFIFATGDDQYFQAMTKTEIGGDFTGQYYRGNFLKIAN